MKWELVVTDPNAGKTGRVRIEAPDQATAERVAAEKGWVVSSVRAFESGAAAPVMPTPPEAAESPSDPSPEESDRSQVSASGLYSDQSNEERRSATVMPLEHERPSRETGAALPNSSSAAQASRRETIPTPDPGVTSKTRGNAFPLLIAFIFWLGGIALIGWGAVQLAYYFGFNPSNGLNETGDVAAAAANRLSEIKALMRELVGGVYIAGGLLAATLGTMLARPPRR